MQYPTSLFLIAVSIFTLNQIDAGLTLILLDNRLIEEVNPLMRILIAQDAFLFIAVKNLVTGSCIVVAVAGSNRCRNKYLMPETALRVILQIYLGLVAYEILLLSLLSEPLP